MKTRSRFVINVINSCNTVEQLESAIEWAANLKNSFSSSVFSDITLNIYRMRKSMDLVQ